MLRMCYDTRWQHLLKIQLKQKGWSGVLRTSTQCSALQLETSLRIAWSMLEGLETSQCCLLLANLFLFIGSDSAIG